MRRPYAVLLLLAATCGCRHLDIDTDSKVAFTTGLATDSKLSFANDLKLGMDSPINVNLALSNPGRVAPVAATPVGAPVNGPKVALIDVDGLLVNDNLTGLGSAGENPIALFHEKLIAAESDPTICAVVVRINSPGGGVAATEVMYHELRRFRERTNKPVVACLLDVGTGGAYYLAAAADRIVAQPGTIVGGIGVILNHYNLTNTLGLVNVIYQPVKAGTNIDMGSQTAVIPPATMKLFQAMADEHHVRFQNVVRERRPNLKADGETFDGRVFTAAQAQGIGLIDQFGFVEDAIAAARELAGQKVAGVVAFRRPGDPMRTPYSVTPNTPIQNVLIPFSIPGIDRTRLPMFLYLWQPDPTIERLTGK